MRGRANPSGAPGLIATSFQRQAGARLPQLALFMGIKETISYACAAVCFAALLSRRRAR
jgi:hypothetical protein